MRGLIQRVSSASVTIDGQCHASIGRGILLLLGIEAVDGIEQSEKLIGKVLNYRIFADAQGRMNLSLKDIGGELLVVSQFTLVAETGKGLRPGFSKAAAPELAESCYEDFLQRLKAQYSKVSSGVFAADMQVSLCNDGPVTFLLET
ncbi:MAG: D-tyrosyl-tRNA(Tyr) deacylase [Gammaproteobacteria bacterium]|nr:D-tyrosyl-tRNA(Tyr) deacylase [Gammaproteobacteria bacterium]MBQ0841092.1 D-tyrosyl-tRNA(Tyr) deacylase [Gammaproteobacteria bacterium]